MRKLAVSMLVLGLVLVASWGELPADHGSLPLVAFHNGDVNGSTIVDLSDAVYLLDWMFTGGPDPVPLDCEPLTQTGKNGQPIHNGDVDGSGAVDISDPIWLLNHLFLGGPALVEGCP